MVITRTPVEHQVAHGETAARRRAAEIWGHWLFSGDDIEERPRRRCHGERQPSPAAQSCIEKVVAHRHEIHGQTLTLAWPATAGIGDITD